MSDFAFTGSFAEVYDCYLVPMDFAPYARQLAEKPPLAVRMAKEAVLRAFDPRTGADPPLRSHHHGNRSQRADDRAGASQYPQRAGPLAAC